MFSDVCLHGSQTKILEKLVFYPQNILLAWFRVHREIENIKKRIKSMSKTNCNNHHTLESWKGYDWYHHLVTIIQTQDMIQATVLHDQSVPTWIIIPSLLRIDQTKGESK